MHTPSMMYTALPSCSYVQAPHSFHTIPQGPTFRDRRLPQFSCANGSNQTAEQELQDAKNTELKEEMARGCTRASMKKVACSVLASATLMCSSLAVGMAESATTPYSQSQSQSERLQIGLINGRIRACPLDINPNCISTSSSNQAYGFPWEIPSSSATDAVKKIENAIFATQKNAQIVKVDEVSDGKRAAKYMVAEVDGFLGRDTLEFLVRDDIVTYRSMAKKVQYVYPFTTPIGDFGTQQKHVKALEDELGWGLPAFDTGK